MKQQDVEKLRITTRFALYNVDEDVSAWIVKSCAEAKVSRNDFIKSALRQAKDGSGGFSTFEAAAELLAQTLEPRVSDMIKASAYEWNQIPLWQAIMGLVNWAEDANVIGSPILHPSWSEGSMEPLSATRCQVCNNSFVPLRSGQIVPDSECMQRSRRRERGESISEVCDYRRRLVLSEPPEAKEPGSLDEKSTEAENGLAGVQEGNAAIGKQDRAEGDKPKAGDSDSAVGEWRDKESDAVSVNIDADSEPEIVPVENKTLQLTDDVVSSALNAASGDPDQAMMLLASQGYEQKKAYRLLLRKSLGKWNANAGGSDVDRQVFQSKTEIVNEEVVKSVDRVKAPSEPTEY